MINGVYTAEEINKTLETISKHQPVTKDRIIKQLGHLLSGRNADAVFKDVEPTLKEFKLITVDNDDMYSLSTEGTSAYKKKWDEWYKEHLANKNERQKQEKATRTHAKRMWWIAVLTLLVGIIGVLIAVC
jgi:hypothetical protein